MTQHNARLLGESQKANTKTIRMIIHK